MRNKVALTCLILGITCSAYFWLHQNNKSPAKALSSDAHQFGEMKPLLAENQLNTPKVNVPEIIHQKTADIKEQINASAEVASNGMDPKALIELFEKLASQHKHFKIDEIEKELLSQFAYDGRNLKFFSEILSDPDIAHSKFGSNQALARVYSLRILRLAYDQELREPLEEALAKLIIDISKHGEKIPGQKFDLENLARGFSKGLSKDEFDNLYETMSLRLGYEIPSKDVQDTLVTAFYVTRGVAMEKADFKRIVKEIAPDIIKEI